MKYRVLFMIFAGIIAIMCACGSEVSQFQDGPVSSSYDSGSQDKPFQVVPVFQTSDAEVIQDSGTPDNNILSDASEEDASVDVNVSVDSSTPTFPPEICDNGIDDDVNGYVDCKDPACKDAPNCKSCNSICYDQLNDCQSNCNSLCKSDKIACMNKCICTYDSCKKQCSGVSQ